MYQDMKKPVKKLFIPCITAVLTVVVFMTGSVHSQNINELDNRAQEHFDKKEFSSAIALWLNILDIEPDNEKIQNKIEMIYELKQRKDVALQTAKLNYQIAKKILDTNYELGKSKAKIAINSYIEAYRIDPEDQELQALKDDMRRLNDQISAEEERRRLSRELQEKNLRLRAMAQQHMEEKQYEQALKIWNDILSFLPSDVIAIEGKRTCRLAIDNRLKFEKIQQFMAKGKELFAAKEFKMAHLEFVQVLSLDPDNRDAKEYITEVNDELDKIRRFEQRKLQAEDFYQSGIRNVDANNFDLALEDFESALALIEDYKDTKQRIAGMDRLRKDYREKEKERRLFTINKEFQDGILAFSEGNYRIAISAFSKTLSLDPDNKPAKDYLQRAQDAQRQLSEEEVDQFSPYYDIVNSLVISGKGLYNKGKYFESRKKWDQILKLFPKNKIATEYILKCDLKLSPDSYKEFSLRIINEGKDSLKKKKFPDALKKFELIKSIDANYPGINQYIAAARGGMTAEKDNLTVADKREVERRLQLAGTYYQRGGRDNYEQALVQYRWITQRDPENVKAVIGANKIESMLRIEPGQGAAGKKPRLTPEQNQLVKKYYYSGINYYTSNNFQKAIDEWRKVLAIDPTHVKAKNNIRKSLAFLGR
jgi:tetratricopeptide (TPR) repeat protein